MEKEKTFSYTIIIILSQEVLDNKIYKLWFKGEVKKGPFLETSKTFGVGLENSDYTSLKRKQGLSEISRGKSKLYY